MRDQSLVEILKDRRVGVVLSSAFFGFYSHTGFVRAVFEGSINPVVFGGSSAGALVSAFAACNHLSQLEELLQGLKRKDIWDPSIPWGKPPGVIRGHKFTRLLAQYLPAETFEQCPTPLVTISTHARTGKISADRSGPIVPAIVASCAVPFMFRPVFRKGEYYVDGGLFDKAPIQATLQTQPVDALLVHIISSHGVKKNMPLHPLSFVDRALDLSRDYSWKIQADLAAARNIPVYVLSSEPKKIGPFSMQNGPKIIDDTYKTTQKLLHQPPVAWPNVHKLN